MTAIADLLKGYFRDKKAHPWHTIYKDIQTYWSKDSPEEELTETLTLLREAVLGALDILSFGLVQELTTQQVLSAFLGEQSWSLGKRKVRNICVDVADELIAKGQIRYLIPAALKRDDFGFLVSRVEEAQWENFNKARPKISRGKLDLRKLEETVLGSQFLREQMIMETKLDSNDPRAEALIEAYDLQLVELEVDRSSHVWPQAPTEQVTLNGQVVQEISDEEKEPSSKKRTKDVVVIPLTEFLEKPTKQKKKTVSDKQGKKKGRKGKND